MDWKLEKNQALFLVDLIKNMRENAEDRCFSLKSLYLLKHFLGWD
jgi:hypothetical protein